MASLAFFCEYILVVLSTVLMSAKCQTPTLQGSSYAVLGNSHRFTCRLNGTTEFGLSFQRGTKTNRGIPCAVKTASCDEHRSENGYSCACVSGETQVFYMDITSVSQQDDGDWLCIYNGQKSNNISLDVYYPPAIKVASSAMTVTENTTLSTDCSSNITPGNPSSTSYRWTGPGGYSKTGSVLDRTVNRTQGGQYTCIATNTAGLSDTAWVNITVQYPPTITSVLGNKNVTEGTSPNIDCSSNITPGKPSSTSYRWTGPDGYTKTGAVLNGTVTRLQGGQYTCNATNTAGLSDTADITINVQYPPNITSVPSQKNMTENTKPRIDCSSNISQGNPSSTSYRWTGPDGYNKTGALLDRTVTRTQGGQYTCTATNTAGLSDTAQVNISVQYPPSINSMQSVKKVAENTIPKIDCGRNITPGNPSSTSYRWTGPGGYIKTGAVLDRNVTRNQGGQYNCTANNTAGLSDTAVININVQYLDFPTVNVSKSETMENGSVQVVCNVTSNPTVQMTIRHVDNKTKIVEQKITNSLKYDIGRLQCLHNGTYMCVAENRDLSRTTNDSTSLNVLCSPRHDFRKYFTRTVARKIGEIASLEVDVIANPLPTFTWWRHDDNQLVSISTNHSVTSKDLHSVLQINVSDSSDYGEYVVQVENSVNKTLLVFNLTTKSSPFAPTGFNAVAGPKAVILQWMSNFNGGAEQTFYLEYQAMNGIWKNYSTIGFKDPGRDKLVTVNITHGLEPGTKYFFKLYSVNIYGLSEQNTTSITTAEATITRPGPKVEAIAGGIAAALLIVIIVVAVCLLYKKRVCGRKDKQSKDVALFERGHPDDDQLVMEDNVLYAGLDDMTGGAAAAAGGDVVPKKTPNTKDKPKDRKGTETTKNKKKAKKGDDQKPLRKKRSRDDAYENTVPGQFEEGACAKSYANAGFEGEETEKTATPVHGRNEDGLLYVGIDFGTHKPSQDICGAEDTTEYSDIAFGKVGPPLPPDEEEKKE